MARREKKMDEEEEEGTEQLWGTLEELLLACAVVRHGGEGWDSVAVELQRRTSRHHLRAFYTAPNCRRRYHDIRRRFAGGDDDGDERLRTVVDELRKLRVAELRRELERHDVSIEFLQLEVKRLEEERERNFTPKEAVKEEIDLPNELDNSKPERNRPQEVAGRSVTGPGQDYDDGDSRSYNESTSTLNQKTENRARDGEKPGVKQEPQNIEPKSEREDPVSVQTGSKAVSDCSHSFKLAEAVEERVNGLPGEPCHSAAESNPEAIKEKMKPSGEVQSSRNRKRRRRSRFPMASSSGEDEAERDEDSAAAKQIASKSRPLINILMIIRSHKNGLVFQRRFRSQETEKYTKTIRQHMDLQTVQSRLDRGFYLDFHRKFFRDLLLLFTNAIVFFPTNSPVHVAALELRKVVAGEMATEFPLPHRPDPAPKPPGSFSAKPITTKEGSPPLVECRRRSSSTAAGPPSQVPKTGTVEAKLGKRLELKRTQNRSLTENRAALVRKQGIKVRQKLNWRNSRTSKKVRGMKNPSDDDEDDDDEEEEEEEDENEEENNDLKSRVKRTGTMKKKPNGPAFLKRTRQNSSSKEIEKDSSDEDEYHDDNSDDGLEVHKKRRKNGRIAGERRKVGRKEQESVNRGERALTNRGKRGRPPKSSPATDSRRDATRGKRGREVSGLAIVADSARSRKRSKR